MNYFIIVLLAGCLVMLTNIAMNLVLIRRLVEAIERDR